MLERKSISTARTPPSGKSRRSVCPNGATLYTRKPPSAPHATHSKFWLKHTLRSACGGAGAFEVLHKEKYTAGFKPSSQTMTFHSEKFPTWASELAGYPIAS